jgi:hypothetical protein
MIASVCSLGSVFANLIVLLCARRRLEPIIQSEGAHVVGGRMGPGLDCLCALAVPSADCVSSRQLPHARRPLHGGSGDARKPASHMCAPRSCRYCDVALAGEVLIALAGDNPGDMLACVMWSQHLSVTAVYHRCSAGCCTYHNAVSQQLLSQRDGP